VAVYLGDGICMKITAANLSLIIVDFSINIAKE
jgi:hypothetical protein